MDKKLMLKGLALVVLVLAAILTYFLFFGGLEIEVMPWLETYGLAGLFVASVIANASLFLVVPIDLIVLFLGEVYPPLVLAAVVGIGASIGEMSGYVVGLGGYKAIKSLDEKNAEKLYQVRDLLKDKGMIFVCLGALTPFPFDLIGIAAGLIRYDVYKFFIAAFAGKFVRYLLIAYAGLFGIQLIKAFFGLA